MTNEESNLENGVTSSLSNGPGAYTQWAYLRYYITLLRMGWGSLTPRQAKRLRKRDSLLVDAIEGILKHG